MSRKAPELLSKHLKLLAHDDGEFDASEGHFTNVPMFGDAHKMNRSPGLSEASTERSWSTYQDKESLPLPSSNYRLASSRRVSSRRASGPAALQPGAPCVDLSEMMRRRRHSEGSDDREDLFPGLGKCSRDKGAAFAGEERMKAKHHLDEYSDQDADDDDNSDGAWSQLDSDSEDDTPRVARQPLVTKTLCGREPPQLLRLGGLQTAVHHSSDGDITLNAPNHTAFRGTTRKVSLFSAETQAGDDDDFTDSDASSTCSRNSWKGIPDLNTSLEQKPAPLPPSVLLSRRPQFSSLNLRVCTAKFD